MRVGTPAGTEGSEDYDEEGCDKYYCKRVHECDTPPKGNTQPTCANRVQRDRRCLQLQEKRKMEKNGGESG